MIIHWDVHFLTYTPIIELTYKKTKSLKKKKAYLIGGQVDFNPIVVGSKVILTIYKNVNEINKKFKCFYSKLATTAQANKNKKTH